MDAGEHSLGGSIGWTLFTVAFILGSWFLDSWLKRRKEKNSNREKP